MCLFNIIQSPLRFQIYISCGYHALFPETFYMVPVPDQNRRTAGRIRTHAAHMVGSVAPHINEGKLLRVSVYALRTRPQHIGNENVIVSSI